MTRLRLSGFLLPRIGSYLWDESGSGLTTGRITREGDMVGGLVKTVLEFGNSSIIG
jgi:hypothetical protein